MYKDLKGKVALITGSSRGIGKNIALALARNGCNIVINDIQPAMDRAKSVVEEVKSLSVDAIALAADVSKFDDVKKMMDEIQKKFGKIDILVNNAGITKDKTLKKMTQDEWNAVININLTSVYNVTHLALPLIPEGGRVINISSVAGISGNFGQCNYAASKAGIIGFTKSLAKEVGKQKITVNAIAPGFIKTEMTDKIPVMMLEQIMELIPMKELGSVQDVANAVLFLASNNARYISAQVLRVDGGITF